VFVAWAGDDEIDAYLAKLGPHKTDVERHEKTLEAVRGRGYSVGLEGGGRAARSMAGRPLTLEDSIRGLRTEEYALIQLDPGATYRANHIGAPVFGPDGGVTVALFIIGFPGPVSGKDIDRIAEKLIGAAARVTKGIHGRAPES
jgi:DNA-binding IclR family transcriptional regulator